MLRVFISHPMNGKTDKEIEEERISIVSKISETVAYMVDTIIGE